MRKTNQPSPEKYLTREGYEKIKQELDDLKNVKRKEMAERLHLAISFGDLSENAAYHEAKEAQGFMEGRILELEDMVRNVTIMEKRNGTGMLGLGSEVTVEAEGGKQKFKIVGKNEADPLGGKISNESPLGKALCNRMIGDVVAIETPAGMVKYKILRIE